MDFLEEAIKEQKELDESYKESLRQTKEQKDRHLESFSDDLRNSIIKKVKKMIRPYTHEEEEILRKGLKENNNG
tara:strand:- start:1346 stop:1567 length:222 start_codon:yes stop_codon:yes gene_type:complete